MPVLDPMFSSAAMDRVFDARARLQGLLDFKTALARAEAAVGVAAMEIGAAGNAADDDVVALDGAARTAGNEAVPTVAVPQQRLSDDARRVVHPGATSRAAIDTGLMLQVRVGLPVPDGQFDTLADARAGHAERYHGTVMAGRTRRCR